MAITKTKEKEESSVPLFELEESAFGIERKPGTMISNQSDSDEAIEAALDNPSEPQRFEKVENEPIAETLTLRQRKFCELYALDTRFMGNGVQAYLEVYDIDQSKPGWYKSACACASKLLSNAKVFNHINSLLESNGLNDASVDKQILYLISQHSNLGAKMSAIQEYNKLKNRITAKVEHSGNVAI